MSKHTPSVINKLLTQEWGKSGVNAWFKSDWINMPARIGAKAEKLFGALNGEIITTDSTSVNLFKLLMCAMQLRSKRRLILTERGNFPTDIYIAESISKILPNAEVKYCENGELINMIDTDVAVVMVSHIDFRSGKLNDLRKLTQAAHHKGALILADLSHSAGVIPLSLADDEVDFAVSSSYKYISGGPGSPAFLYVAQKYQKHASTPISGWMGHLVPFDFSEHYTPAHGIKKFLCGTPPILAMLALEHNLDQLNRVSIKDIRTKNLALTDLMIELMKTHCPDMTLLTPSDHGNRGGHLAYTHQNAKTIYQKLGDAGYVCDYRPPNLLRFGLAPLYLRYIDIYDTVITLSAILSEITS
jgi:kynureninase